MSKHVQYYWIRPNSPKVKGQSRAKVQASRHFEKSGFKMVGTMAIAMVPTIWNPNHSKTDLQNVQFLNGWFSDPHCIKVHGFEIPDVIKTHPMSRNELWAMSLELQGPNFVSSRVEPDAVCDVNSSHQGTLATHNLIQNKTYSVEEDSSLYNTAFVLATTCYTVKKLYNC